MRSLVLPVTALCLLLLVVHPAQAQRPQQPAPTEMLTQYAPGVLAKTSFRATTRDALAIEIWDLVVGPGKRSERFLLPGGAVLEVKSGRGSVDVAGKSNDVRLGSVISVAERDSLALTNNDPEASLVLRAVVVRSARR